MSDTMAFNRMMSRKEVIEKYGIPTEWEKAVFAAMKPISGFGEDAIYLKSVVDETLHRMFGKTDRPPRSWTESSFKKEEINVKGWAGTVEEPQDESGEAEKLLVNANVAARMLDISPRTLFQLDKNGTLVSKRIGKLKRYAVADLRAFAEGKVA